MDDERISSNKNSNDNNDEEEDQDDDDNGYNDNSYNNSIVLDFLQFIGCIVNARLYLTCMLTLE